MQTGNLDGQGIAELQNYKFQNLSSAPTTNLYKGRFYFNTTDNTLYVYDGTQWMDALKQGLIYTEGNGIDITNQTISVDVATGANAGNVSLSATSNGLAGSVAAATTSAAGVIEIATDAEATAGTDTSRAVTPKQLAGKVNKLSTAPTTGTYTKVTINGDGLVTSGENLSASDIPNLTLSKITDVTATASEVNVLDGITASTTELNYVDGVTSNIQTQLDGKVDELTTKPTAGTYTKVTINNEGQVTSGTTLSATDIPNLTLSKISDVTASVSEVNVLDGITASTTELNYVDGVTSNIQTQLDGKVDELTTKPTAGTYTKVTINNEGQVTNGAALSATDIPNLTLSKITDVTATATEVNVLDGITASTTELNYVDGVTSNIQTQLDNKLAKKPDGTNDLIDSNNKVTLGYLPDVVLGQMLYAGTFVPSTAVATLSDNAKAKLGTSSDTITLTNNTTAITGYTDNEGNYYLAEADGTFASIDFLTGDWLVSTGSSWKKIDNTDAVTGVKGAAETNYRIGNVNITADNVLPAQASNSGKFLTTDGTNCSWGTVPDTLPSQTGNNGKFLTTNGTTPSWAEVDAFPVQTGNNGKFLTTDGSEVSWSTAVTPSGTQTLTNKTIDANNNTISDLTTSNLKSGVLQTTVRATATASDTAIASEKAIATALAGKSTVTFVDWSA